MNLILKNSSILDQFSTQIVGIIIEIDQVSVSLEEINTSMNEITNIVILDSLS